MSGIYANTLAAFAMYNAIKGVGGGTFSGV
jgi:hypothetical protein